MKRQLVLAENQANYNFVTDRLGEGWILDPTYDSKPLRMENAIVFPLVLYESEEEKPKPVEELKGGEFDDVVSLRDVPNAEVDGLLKEGYVINTIYAKSTIMVKRKMKEERDCIKEEKEAVK